MQIKFFFLISCFSSLNIINIGKTILKYRFPANLTIYVTGSMLRLGMYFLAHIFKKNEIDVFFFNCFLCMCQIIKIDIDFG